MPKDQDDKTIPFTYNYDIVIAKDVRVDKKQLPNEDQEPEEDGEDNED